MSQPQEPSGEGGSPGWGRPDQPHPQPFPRPGHAPGPGSPPHGAPVHGPPQQPWAPQPGWGQQPVWGQQPGWGQQPARGPGQPWPPPGGWAQPGAWGSPPPAPRRRRRWPWLLGLFALAVVVGAVALPLALRQTALDPQAVQRDVAAQYQQLRGGSLQLRCARDMPVEVDRTYRCTGTTATNGTVDITIRVTGRDGAYTWSDGS